VGELLKGTLKIFHKFLMPLVVKACLSSDELSQLLGDAQLFRTLRLSAFDFVGWGMAWAGHQAAHMEIDPLRSRTNSTAHSEPAAWKRRSRKHPFLREPILPPEALIACRNQLLQFRSNGQPIEESRAPERGGS
jgi:hypothetical protein